MLESRNLLKEKWRESLTSVLPITIIVFLICFFLIPVSNSALLAFIFGALLLIFGMGLFTLGTDIAMTPIGEYAGSAITRTRKLWMVVAIGLVMGIVITISEPDLQVLAEQVSDVPNMTLILAVAVGVGIFLVIALLRILLRIKMWVLLLISYAIVFTVAFFVPDSFLAVAFDAGGVTTGPMTVPFILALGVGVSAMRSDRNADSDSFGLVALCSVGPILAVMILGLIYKPGQIEQSAAATVTVETSTELWHMFVSALPKYMKEVGVALAPIAVFFLILQFTMLKLHFHHVARILVGIVYTYIGLVLFLLGVNVGFMPVGKLIGLGLGRESYRWILVPLGMVIGYFVVSAEPAVHVLSKQVYEMTAGAIPKKALSTTLSIGVSISVGLAMLRILLRIPIMYLMIPGYAIALILMFFVPPIFTSIAFDSGGVASGPMTATFLLPLAMGACEAVGGNIASDAFGVVAMVAMTPLIAIQILGLYFKLKQKHADGGAAEPEDEDIIEM